VDLAYLCGSFAFLCVKKINKRKGRQGFRKGAQSLSFPFSYRHTFNPSSGLPQTLTGIFVLRIVTFVQVKEMHRTEINCFAFTYRFSFWEADWRMRAREAMNTC